MKMYNYRYLNRKIDVSEQVRTLGNVRFTAQRLEGFDPEKGRGNLRYERYEWKNRMAFNAYGARLEQRESWGFPAAYPDDPVYPFVVEFVAENVIRIRTSCRCTTAEELPMGEDSVMLCKKPEKMQLIPEIADETHAVYRTSRMIVEVQYDPFRVVVKDTNGREITRTLHNSDSRCLQNFNPMPVSFVRSCEDMHKYPAMSMQIHPGEHFYGCGESFTKLDKLGQKIVLYTRDPNTVESDEMYKPVPFYISSRGYGVFYHTSCPLTLDFGYEYAEAATAYLGDENVDMFLFTGDPKTILGAYTDLVGKSPLPPIWSFGLWMSRITYKTEEEVREVAAMMKEKKIPCDVIHLDTGWFEEDWRCDFKFSESRFKDAEKMIADLNKEGYRISLWQYPYSTPANKMTAEILEKKLAVVNADGELPTDDAVLDFSNPEAVKWYQEKIEALLRMGVSAIKADFGEAAPVAGSYHSGKSGYREHNLYPVRYNKAVYEAMQNVHGEGVIFGRSAWAGSQRYPLHWGGDCENTDMGMLSSLRGGLSFGASGFSYWSHDVGGFVRQSPEELYNRWAFMAIFTSHMRCHGQPPKEPWAYSEAFLNSFRSMLELRYRLMPYIYAQSIQCSETGIPLLRPMYMEYPSDPACQGMEDQYFFGNDILVAPLFEEDRTRNVYLPAGRWTEIGSRKVYESGWHTITASVYPGLAFVRAGARIPMVEAALTTDAIDWSSLQYVVFDDGSAPAVGLEVDVASRKVTPATEKTPYILASTLKL